MELSQYIDHTILKQTTVDRDIEKLCQEAISYNFAAVCVPPHYVKMSCELLQKSDVKVATVIGFPFGYSDVEAKLVEIKNAINNGADELDIVLNISYIKTDRWDDLKNEIKTLNDAVKKGKKISKIIIESGILSDKEIILTCQICAENNVDFVKTSTGYAESGASIRDVKLMRETLPPHIKIKASGGIRNYTSAMDMIQAGADRIGTSSGVAIINSSKK